MLFKKEKRNPILEIQEHLEKEGVILGKLENNGQVESNSKLSYSIVEHIYALGTGKIKKQNTINKIIFIVVGLVIGFLAAMLVMSLLRA
jgi:hypothetical protein